MSTKLLAYVVLSFLAFAGTFCGLLFTSTVLNYTVPGWIIVLFMLITGNLVVSMAIFIIQSFRNSGED